MHRNVAVIHYHEIGLKGKNRVVFENKLIENARKALRGLYPAPLRRIGGRILVYLPDDLEIAGEAIRRLSYLFGISYIAHARECPLDMDAIKSLSLEMIKGKEFSTLKVDTKRSDKRFPLTSMEVNREVGAYLIANTGAKADMCNPDITCYIEITEKSAFVYLEKFKGPGGLPTGTGGKAISMLSGGIDSPVASFKVMKRGLELSFIHFHSHPYTDLASLEKVREIVRILSRHQLGSRLYFVPFIDVQKEIMGKTPPLLRVLLYRRMMLRIAERVARMEGAKAIVTGDSLGQVASQTLDNIIAISSAVSIPILRPLIGEDKEEIINQAKRIGTYDISILPHQDCCSLFIPRHPATHASPDQLDQAESSLNLEELILDAMSRMEVEEIEGIEPED
jgi:thiamine biosynthesis protein ThiI